MNGKHYVGRKATSFQNYGEIDAVSGVVLTVDEEHQYRAGDDSGYVLEVECPYGTQAMADGILASLAGKKYVAYMAENAPLPVTAELGDGVTVNGIYSQLASRQIAFGPGHLSDISAPADGQVSHEFGYSDPVQRETERKLARSRSFFEKQTDEIRMGVEEFEKGVNAELELKVGRDENDQIVSMLNASADQINISGNRLVIDSSNFKVSADGTVTAKNGSFTGTIDANAGRIGAFDIEERLGGMLLTNGAITIFDNFIEIERDSEIYTIIHDDSVKSPLFIGDLEGTADRAKNIQTGIVTVSCTPDTVASADVRFPRRFDGSARVTALPYGSNLSTFKGISVTNVTDSGFMVHILRTNTVNADIYWIAALGV